MKVWRWEICTKIQREKESRGREAPKKKTGHAVTNPVKRRAGEEVRDWRWRLVLRRWGTARWIMFLFPAACCSSKI